MFKIVYVEEAILLIIPKSKAEIDGGSAINSNSGGASFGIGAASSFFCLVTDCSSSDCFLATASAGADLVGLSSALPSLETYHV